MKKTLWLASLGAAVLFLCSSPLAAQEVVFNGDFELGTYSPTWTLTGGNTYTQIAYFQTKLGQNSLCLKRRPGPPSSNGGIEQNVHLIGGVMYVFTADIASQYCSS
jgi:hypothetical protein